MVTGFDTAMSFVGVTINRCTVAKIKAAGGREREVKKFDVESRRFGACLLKEPSGPMRGWGGLAASGIWRLPSASLFPPTQGVGHLVAGPAIYFAS